MLLEKDPLACRVHKMLVDAGYKASDGTSTGFELYYGVDEVTVLHVHTGQWSKKENIVQLQKYQDALASEFFLKREGSGAAFSVKKKHTK